MNNESKGLNAPMAIGFSVASFGLLMGFLNPGSFWSITAIVGNVVVGAIMLWIADREDANINFAGFVCTAVGMICLIYLTNRDANERYDVEVARAVTILAKEKLESCGKTITQQEIQYQLELQRSDASLMHLFPKGMPQDSVSR